MFKMPSTIVFCFVMFTLPVAADAVVDEIQFGAPASEQNHALEAKNSRVTDGALNTRIRQLLPPETEGWLGGTLTFMMKVDPDRPNYFTAKFWGSDVTGEHSRLMLFIDGKQVGQRHLGEVDMLDIMYDYPRYPGRFFYKTLPLPEAMTAGKDSVKLTIQAQGPIWGYGDTAEKFQKMMAEPSRGLYRAYVHTEPFFAPNSDELLGEAVEETAGEPTAGPEVVEEIRQAIDDGVKDILQGDSAVGSNELHLLTRSYHQPWSVAHDNPEVIKAIVRGIDQRYHEFINDSEDPESTVGHWWIGYGPDGEAIFELYDDLVSHLDQPLEGTDLTRRAAYADLLQESRDWHAERRRSYTNQSMIVDVNTYRADLGLRVLDPERAWPEEKGLRMLHESAGIEPWSGDWERDGSRDWRMGESFYLLTDQALSKELGYVGDYGENICELVLTMYNATRPTPDAEGDPRLKAQLVKLTRARSYFRYPTVDAEGRHVMRLETAVGWRDWYYPGSVLYDQLSGRDGGAPDVAGATLDPVLIGYHQQMLADRQFYPVLAKRAGGNKGTNAQKLAAFVLTLNYLDKLADQPESPQRLPMTPGEPDFVFADPEIAVVAIKNGDEILYASLYWRARYAINNLARVHHLTPTMERDATVRIDTRFEDSGHVYTMPDQTNEPFSTRHEKFYKSFGMHLATAGIQQPIAKVPDDQKDYKPGKENIHAGKGDFYLMQYGPYLIAMNCTDDQTHGFDVPAAFAQAKDLTTGADMAAGTTKIVIAPGQTVVLYQQPDF